MVCSPSGRYEEGIHYTVKTKIGQGSSATVDLTEDLQLKKQSARKRLICEDEARYEGKESKVMLALRYYNISPKLHAVVETEAEVDIFMEVINGIPLRKFISTIRQDRFSDWSDKCVTKALCVILEIVLELHRRGWVHKDLHGANILLILAEGQIKAKLIDFGISQELKPDKSNYKNRRTDLVDILKNFFCLYTRPSGRLTSPPSYKGWKDNLQSFLQKVNQNRLFELIDEATAKEEKKEADTQLLSFLKEIDIMVPQETIKQIMDSVEGSSAGKGHSMFPANVTERPDPRNRQAVVIEGQDDEEVLELHNKADEFQDVAARPRITLDDIAAIAHSNMHPKVSGPEITGQNTTQPCAITSVPHVPEYSTPANMPPQLPSASSLPQPIKILQFFENLTEQSDLLNRQELDGTPHSIDLSDPEPHVSDDKIFYMNSDGKMSLNVFTADPPVSPSTVAITNKVLKEGTVPLKDLSIDMKIDMGIDLRE